MTAPSVVTGAHAETAARLMASCSANCVNRRTNEVKAEHSAASRLNRY